MEEEQENIIDGPIVQRLLGYLEAKLDFKDAEVLNCSHKPRMARHFLGEHLESEEGVEEILNELAEEGGSCDCEILLNIG